MTNNTAVKELLDWVLHIFIAVLIGFLIVTFVAQRTVVNKYSMEPTLYQGDNLLVEKISPKIGRLHAGDIVTIANASEAFAEEGKVIIKRIIAVAGDTVEIKDGKVYVNGAAKQEGYIKGEVTLPGLDPDNSKLTVNQGFVYVLGDNRGNSTDSRALGQIDIKNIRGKAIFRFYPLKRFGTL